MTAGSMFPLQFRHLACIWSKYRLSSEVSAFAACKRKSHLLDLKQDETIPVEEYLHHVRSLRFIFWWLLCRICCLKGRFTDRLKLIVEPLARDCDSELVRLLADVYWISHVELTCVAPSIWPLLCALAMRFSIFPFSYIDLTVWKRCLEFNECIVLPLSFKLNTIRPHFECLADCLTVLPEPFEVTLIKIYKLSLAMGLTIHEVSNEFMSVRVLAASTDRLSFVPVTTEQHAIFRRLDPIAVEETFVPLALVAVTVRELISTLTFRLVRSVCTFKV